MRIWCYRRNSHFLENFTFRATQSEICRQFVSPIMIEFRLIGVAPAARSLAFWSYKYDANDGMYRPYNIQLQTIFHRGSTMSSHCVWFTGHMECAAFKLAKMFKENGNERCYIFRCLFCCALSNIRSLVSNYNQWTTIQVLTTYSPYSAYENPTPIGWSMKKTLAFSFQEYGLKVELSGFVTRHGPSSMNNPIEDEHPGPPFVQKITSSLSGSLLLSKK